MIIGQKISIKLTVRIYNTVYIICITESGKFGIIMRDRI